MYQQLMTTAEADTLINSEQPHWILKHSITCPVSAYGMQEFISHLKANPQERAAVIVVQHARIVSNHLAQQLGVKHESPQLLLVQEGRVLWHGSHGAVTAENMREARTAAVDY